MGNDSRRELWLLRHAKSAWDTDAPTDFERPLGPRGRKDAPRMGAWMAEHGLWPDLVLTSPARRAEETLALVLEALDEASIEVRHEEAIYDAALEDLVGLLRALPETASRVLLVGHNPGLDELAGWLSDEAFPLTARGKLMTTCALARFDLPGPWAEAKGGRATALRLTRPSDL